MRVLHVVTRFARGGSERDISHQLGWEQAHGVEVDVLIGAASAAGALAEGVTLHRARALVAQHNPLADAQALAEVRSIVRHVAPDIVFTHQSKAGVIGRLAARGLARRIVHIVHMASFGPGYSAVPSRLQAAAERYCGRFTDLVVCVGEELRALYLSNRIGTRDSFEIMRTPVDIDSFARARWITEAERTLLRASFAVSAMQVLVVAIGALEPRKRHALMFEQLAPMLRSGGAVLALAGDGPLQTELRALSRSLQIDGSVRFLGQVPRIEDLLACADVLLLASRVEGVPRVVIEALAAGVPIVATEVEGLREVPNAPISVLPRTGAGMADAVTRVLTEPRHEPVALSALGAWRPGSVDAQLESIYERLVGVPTYLN